MTEHACENCYYDFVHPLAYPCSMCVCGIERTDMFQPKITETQNSNLTFEKRTMRDCYNCKRYETEDECIECHYEPTDEPQTYITEDRDTQILDAWQVHHRSSTTAIEEEPQTDCPYREYPCDVCDMQTDCAWK